MSIFKIATSFLGGIQTYLIVGAVSAALAFGGGIWLEVKISRGEINALKLADAKAQTTAVELAAAVQRAQDLVGQSAAVAETKAQGDLQLRQYQLSQKVSQYVTPHQDAVVCVPVGLVRLLNAAVLQTDPGAIKLAAGQSDDACSDVKASLLGGAIVEWLYTANANAEQLNALIAWVKANHQAQESVK